MADSFVVAPVRFYHYRCVETSMVNSFRKNADKEQLSVMNEMWKFKETFHKNVDFEKAMYMLSFVSLQMCIWQKFYNKLNTDSWTKRRLELKRFIKQKPYDQTMKNVPFYSLRANQKIKFILLKMHLYSLLVDLRSMYNKKTGKIS